MMASSWMSFCWKEIASITHTTWIGKAMIPSSLSDSSDESQNIWPQKTKEHDCVKSTDNEKTGQ